ncbi:MAG: hypothetical protein NW206_06140 [Hyphomonadaceae bacterium]|nr:hypothetical protein [Hyphomonadaceae bacterium]
MAARSPNYPSMDLGAALAAIEPAYKGEHRNRMGRLTLAKHLGYNSLNGRALAKIAAVRAYGLIEGQGDEVKVSEDAIDALMAPKGSGERVTALTRCALRPSLFKEIATEFATLPSETNLSYWIIKKGFTPDAAGRAAKNYLNTMRLVADPNATYNPASSDDEAEDYVDLAPPAPSAGKPNLSGGARPTMPPDPRLAGLPAAGMRTAVFTVEGGDVTLTFPADLSALGYEDLEDYLKVFFRRAKREHAEKANATVEKTQASINAKNDVEADSE